MIPIKNFTPIGTELELPPGYTACEYLIFDGSSWIETDITPDNRLLTFEANALLDFSINNRDGCLLGSRNISNYVGGITVWYNTVTKPDNGFGGVRVVSSGMTTWVPIQADTGLLHKIEYDGTSVYIDGEFQFSGRYGVIENLSYPKIKIGCLASEGSNLTDRPFLGKVGIIKFWQDGVQVSCFIPVIDPSGVPCMYDTIGKKPYYNRGSGTFSYKIKD